MICVEPGAGGQVMPMPMLIGTSGWQYRDWRGGLYPPGRAAAAVARALRHQYLHRGEQQQLLPAAVAGDVRRLAGAHPGRLRHGGQGQPVSDPRKRLRDPAEPVARLLGAAAGLGTKLGPVLLQLPPTLKADPDTLDACLKEFRTAAAARASTGSGSRWSRGTRPGGPTRYGRSWPRTTRRCAGPTGAAARSRLCGVPRRGVTCGSTRARPSRGPATGRRR